jgi:hypothetical protein
VRVVGNGLAEQAFAIGSGFGLAMNDPAREGRIARLRAEETDEARHNDDQRKRHGE